MRNLLCAFIASGLAAVAMPAAAIDSEAPPHTWPSATAYSAAPLPELQGVVSWKMLAQVEAVKQNTRMVPRFSKEILSLDKQQVRIQGFIFPLDARASLHEHFLISAVEPSCPVCLPAGPEALVEIFARKSVGYSAEPVVIEGKLAVLGNDATGLLYRLENAEVVGPVPNYSRAKPVFPAAIWSWPEPISTKD